MEVHVVTGAFGYSGSYIARRLLDAGHRVRTLTGSPNRGSELAGAIEVAPLAFDDPDALVDSLRGAKVLYNTYWVRFNHRRFRQADAEDNTLALFAAASPSAPAFAQDSDDPVATQEEAEGGEAGGHDSRAGDRAEVVAHQHGRARAPRAQHANSAIPRPRGGARRSSIAGAATLAQLRLQFAVPVEIVEPAFVQVVGRKLAAGIVQVMHGRVIGLLRREHARVLRHLAALLQVERNDDVDQVRVVFVERIRLAAFLEQFLALFAFFKADEGSLFIAKDLIFHKQIQQCVTI